MPRARKKAKPTPVADKLGAPRTIDDVWPLPVSYACGYCRGAMLGPGLCKRKNKAGVSICKGRGEQVKVYRAKCECCRWTCMEKQLLQRCGVCHRRVVAYTDEEIGYWEMTL